jgi:hypothetical protein
VASCCSIQLITVPFGETVSCGPMLAAPVSSEPGLSASSHRIGLGADGVSATGPGDEHPATTNSAVIQRGQWGRV